MRFGKKNRRLVAALILAAVTEVFVGGGAVQAFAKTGEVRRETEAARLAAVENDAAETAGQNAGETAGARQQEPPSWGTRAEEIQWSGNMACQVFFDNGYYFQLVWNHNYVEYGTVRSMEINGETWRAAFYDGTEELADDREFLKALNFSLQEREKEREKKRENSVDDEWPEWEYERNPIVSYVKGPYTQTASELAKQSYEEDDLIFFSVVIEKADLKTQESLADAAYEKENYSYYSILVELLSGEKQKELALRAYEEDRIALFTLAAESLSPEEKAELKERAAEEGRLDFYYIINESLH